MCNYIIEAAKKKGEMMWHRSPGERYRIYMMVLYMMVLQVVLAGAYPLVMSNIVVEHSHWNSGFTQLENGDFP